MCLEGRSPDMALVVGVGLGSAVVDQLAVHDGGPEDGRFVVAPARQRREALRVERVADGDGPGAVWEANREHGLAIVH